MPPSTNWAIVAGFITALLVWIAKLNKLDVPAELSSLGTAAITILVQHFVKDPPEPTQ